MKVKHIHYMTCVHVHAAFMLYCFTPGSLPPCDEVQWPKGCLALLKTDKLHHPHCSSHSIYQLFFFISILSCSGKGISASEGHSRKRVLQIAWATGHVIPMRLNHLMGLTSSRSTHTMYDRSVLRMQRRQRQGWLRPLTSMSILEWLRTRPPR